MITYTKSQYRCYLCKINDGKICFLENSVSQTLGWTCLLSTKHVINKASKTPSIYCVRNMLHIGVFTAGTCNHKLEKVING